MVAIKYLNQYSSNPEAVIKFYKDVIGLEVVKPQDHWYGFAQAPIQFAIEPEKNREDNVEQYEANWNSPYLVQIGVDSQDEMREILARAKKAGTPILVEFEKRSFGTLSKLLDPDKNMVELILQ